MLIQNVEKREFNSDETKCENTRNSLSLIIKKMREINSLD